MTRGPLHILLTGAASGLGRGLALYFAGKDHRPVLVDQNPKGLRETVGLLGPAAERASAQVIDVTSAGQVRHLLAALGGQPVELLINDAGLQHVARLEDFPEERWDVLVASPFKSADVAARHGLLGFTKVLALETADADITVNTVCPGYIRTPLVDAQIAAQARAHGISEQEVIERIMLEPMPKKQFITVEEVAATIEFLASHAARNITGQTIVLDGGWTAR
jgi:3-hydroxybutyrate dehydrogenase